MERSSIHRKETAGFSLLETMLVLAIFSIIALLLTTTLNSTSTAFIRAKDRVQQFGSARLAFDYMSRNIKQATLNTYWDYKYSSADGNDDANPSAPEGYTPISDIQFKIARASELLGNESGSDGKFQSHAVFFQAPLGASDRYTSLSNLLNARGYFIEFGDDLAHRPDFLGERIAPRYRYRLKEFRPPGENNWIYKELKNGSGGSPEFNEWFRADSDLYDIKLPYHKVVRNVADNVIALIVSPRISEKEAKKLGYQFPQEYAPNYTYDSRLEYPTGNRKERNPHQLPPLIKLIMVTVSEKSAIEMQRRNGDNPPPELLAGANLFRDSVKLEEDLNSFEKQLKDNNIEYRIFQTVVGMQSAKWSDAK